MILCLYLLNKALTHDFLAWCAGKHDLTSATAFRELARKVPLSLKIIYTCAITLGSNIWLENQKSASKTKQQAEKGLTDLWPRETWQALNEVEVGCQGPGTDSGWAEGCVEPRDFKAICSIQLPFPESPGFLEKLEVLSGLVSDENNHDSVFRENDPEDAMFSVIATLDGRQVMEQSQAGLRADWRSG